MTLRAAAIALLAFDPHLVDVAGVQVADRPFDQGAFLMNGAGRDRLQRPFPDVVPQPQRVFVVAADLQLVALLPGGPDDQAHALRHLQLARDRLEARAIGGIGDLARDAAAARGVRHQHAVAAGERQISGQRRPFVAPLLLDHLDQQDLAPLDHLLDLVAAQQPRAALGLLVEDLGGLLLGVGGDRLRARLVGFLRAPLPSASLGDLALGLVEHAPVGLRESGSSRGGSR